MKSAERIAVGPRPLEGQGLSAGEVARRLGVAVTTVRTWDRRYGLGPSRRDAGRHRRYDELDVARLTLMGQLLHEGVRAAQAARMALALPEPEPHDGLGTLQDSPRHRTERAAARGLRRAALDLDVAEVDRILRRALASGVVDAWGDVICPVLRHIDRRHIATGRFVEAEHLLSRAVSAALVGVSRPTTPAGVLLACGPEEQHTLALEALAAALAERGNASRLLGARVPPLALGDAIARSGPGAVVLWSQSPATADPAFLDVARAARPRPPVIAAAGPGWAPDRLPSGVASPTDLPAALALCAALP